MDKFGKQYVVRIADPTTKSIAYVECAFLSDCLDIKVIAESKEMNCEIYTMRKVN
jgi:hypothetical protein